MKEWLIRGSGAREDCFNDIDSFALHGFCSDSYPGAHEMTENICGMLLMSKNLHFLWGDSHESTYQNLSGVHDGNKMLVGSR